jgi:hypothetical protein
LEFQRRSRGVSSAGTTVADPRTVIFISSLHLQIWGSIDRWRETSKNNK